MIWEDYEEGIERDIFKRTMEFASKLESSSTKCNILNENKIVRLCNLINNPTYTNIEDTSFEPSISFVK